MINLHERILPTSARGWTRILNTEYWKNVANLFRGLNPRPPGLQSDGASNWATEAAALVDPLSLMIYANIQPQSILGSREEDL